MRLSPPAAPPGAGSPLAAENLRREVRAFLESAEFTPRCDNWLTGFDPAFSRSLGGRGWLGMTVPDGSAGTAAARLSGSR